MKVEIDKSFPMPGPAAVAWALLQDIEKVAGCMPGAKITEKLDAQHYKGTVAVKFGPANMAFRGEVVVQQVDAATQTLRLVGKGTDTTGSSGASMDLTARIEAVDANSCNLVGHSEVSMSGKAATFGGRMAGAVADQVLKQFAGNFANQVQALHALQAPEPAASQAQGESAAPPAAGDGAAGAVPGAPEGPTGAAPKAATMSAPSTGAAPTPSAAATAKAAIAPPAEAQLNGLALAWGILRDWFASLFAAGRK
jgi:uncharacterized protein